MKHIITPTATSNAEKKQYLNANGWSERLVADIMQMRKPGA